MSHAGARANELGRTMRTRGQAAAIAWGCWPRRSLPALRRRPSNSWPKFPGSAYGSQGDATDREFIKEWEATPPKGYPTLSPANLAAMKAAIKRYTEIVAGGGWQPIPEVQLQSGMSHPAVALLRQRLILSGDLREAGGSQSFDFYVEKAVKRYQASNGLAPTGIVDKRTIVALNVPAAARLKQLKINLERLNGAAKSPRSTSSSTSPPRRSRSSRATASSRATPASSASPTGRRRSSTRRSTSSTSTRCGTCRRR